MEFLTEQLSYMPLVFISWLILFLLLGDKSFIEKIKFSVIATGIAIFWVIIAFAFKTIPIWLIVIAIIAVVVYFINKNKKEDCTEKIDSYLSTYSIGDTKFKVMKNDLKDCIDNLSAKINNMGYDNFLNTDYWKSVANKVKKEANYECVQCGAESNLEVHHLSYDNHGKEHLYWKTDLICLCTDCHSKMHSDDGQ